MMLLLLLLKLLLLHDLVVVINYYIMVASNHTKVIVEVVKIRVIEIVIIWDYYEISSFLWNVLVMIPVHYPE